VYTSGPTVDNLPRKSSYLISTSACGKWMLTRYGQSYKQFIYEHNAALRSTITLF